jgi:effector-binding domain-containing protein
MQLTLEPDTVIWPETHYVFVEKTGPFQNTAHQAWQQLHQRIPELLALNYQIDAYFSLYKMDQQIYRAGVALPARPDDLPVGLHYEHFRGGPYLRFILTGPYSQLGEASGRVWQVIRDKNITLRDDFNIENYVNNPDTTPEDQLITEILFPVA